MDWNRLLNLPGYSVSLRHNRTITEEWLNEYYSVLYVEIVISRQLVNLLMGVYFSTFLIVIIMISTFWLNSFLITDRINIGVISVLALYDQYNESKKGLPSIGYMHPLAYWIIICMLFVFAQLFQNSIFYYIVINKKSLINRKNKKMNPFKRNQVKDSNNKENDDDSKEFLHSFISVQLDRDSLDYIPMKFDMVSRLTFCVFIIFFLAIYWPNSIKLSYTYNVLNH